MRNVRIAAGLFLVLALVWALARIVFWALLSLSSLFFSNTDSLSIRIGRLEKRLQTETTVAKILDYEVETIVLRLDRHAKTIDGIGQDMMVLRKEDMYIINRIDDGEGCIINRFLFDAPPKGGDVYSTDDWRLTF